MTSNLNRINNLEISRGFYVKYKHTRKLLDSGCTIVKAKTGYSFNITGEFKTPIQIILNNYCIL